jgi:hypothetical protein
MQLPPSEGLLRGEPAWLGGRNCPDLVQALKSPCVSDFVGGIKHVVLAFRAMQQVKGDEALDLAKA